MALDWKVSALTVTQFTLMRSSLDNYGVTRPGVREDARVPKVHMSWYSIKSIRSEFGKLATSSHLHATSKRDQAGGERRCVNVLDARLKFPRVYKRTIRGITYAGLVGLTGCATSAEFEFLRAEVARANAIAVRAEADACRTQRQLEELKSASGSPEALAKQKKPATTATLPSASGYKWGKLLQN